LIANVVGTGKTILVPLTSSLYVPGQLADTDKVIIDVGTGFYVEKVLRHKHAFRFSRILTPETCSEAQRFYDLKIEDLTKNLKSLEGIVQEKSGNLRAVEESEHSRGCEVGHLLIFIRKSSARKCLVVRARLHRSHNCGIHGRPWSRWLSEKLPNRSLRTKSCECSRELPSESYWSTR